MLLVEVGTALGSRVVASDGILQWSNTGVDEQN